MGAWTVAVSVAVEQVLDLASQGVRKFHFFTLNKSDLAVAVCHSLDPADHARGLHNHCG